MAHKDINIYQLKDAFDFHSNSCIAVQNQVNINYTNILSEKFQGLLHQLLLDNSEKYEEVIVSLNLLNEKELEYFLVTPEISHLILQSDRYNKATVINMLIKSIDAEISKKTRNFDINKYEELWTADGALFIKYIAQKKTYAEFENHRLFDLTPVDFFSPFNMKITNKELNEGDENVISLYDFGEIETICQSLDESIEPILNCNHISHQIRTFLKSIVINKITLNGKPTNLISGSDALYIGRTVMSNVYNSIPEKLIECLVHESIHSTLYMADICNPWLPTHEQTRIAGYNAISPWTGNKITISSIQEAIFVWYGIYKLWSYALENGLYDENRTLDRLTFVGQGFRRLDIAQIAASCNVKINEELNNTVNAMKQDIIGSIKVHS